MDLVDEEDDVAPAADLFEDLLQPFLEVAPVAGTGHQGAQVEGVEVLLVQRLGDFAGNDLLGETLDDGGLAHTGLSHQDRVVLGSPGQHLHDPLDLVGAADDRVELAVAGHLGQVASELVEHRGTGGRR